MTGYTKSDQPEQGVLVFLEMLGAGARPTSYTLGSVLDACSSLGFVEFGKQIHAYAIKCHAEVDKRAGNFLCILYSKYGGLDSAVKAFRRIKEKNVVSWTAVISACDDHSHPLMGLRLFLEMLQEGIQPNEYTLTSVLSSSCASQALLFGAQVHSMCNKLGFASNSAIANSIIYLYLKFGWVNYANKLVDQMDTIGTITWNTMIAGHAQMMDLVQDDISAHSSGNEALHIFQKLTRSGAKPDPFTLSSVLTVCSKLVALEQGEQLHARIIKTGYLSDAVVGTALVNMYSKCGSIDEASKAFEQIPVATLFSLTSMITGFARHGQSQKALELFNNMRHVGIRPNKVTFVGVLLACSLAGMVDEAMYYFELMKSEYKIKPTMDHFACLVDMFLRLGQLDKAFDFVKEMEIQPNEFIWSILVAGCKSHGRLDIGFHAAEELLSLKPKRTETYVLLLSMYYSMGRSKDLSRVKQLMKEQGVENLKDWSWIRFKGTVYLFKPDDQLGLQSAGMYELLEDLLNKSKALGYEPGPRGSLDVTNGIEGTDEGEEGSPLFSAVYHSEKLALAFGLLNMPNAVPIRVIKNTGMCRDCHSFIKFVSLLVSREIIVRDCRRLHKFKDGYCSCRDYGEPL